MLPDLQQTCPKSIPSVRRIVPFSFVPGSAIPRFVQGKKRILATTTKRELHGMVERRSHEVPSMEVFNGRKKQRWSKSRLTAIFSPGHGRFLHIFESLWGLQHSSPCLIPLCLNLTDHTFQSMKLPPHFLGLVTHLSAKQSTKVYSIITLFKRSPFSSSDDRSSIAVVPFE